MKLIKLPIFLVIILFLIPFSFATNIFYDEFDRSNENPISTNGWTNLRLPYGNALLDAQSLYIYTSGSSSDAGSYNNINLTPPFDVYFVSKLSSPNEVNMRVLYGGNVSTTSKDGLINNSIGIYYTDQDLYSGNVELGVMQNNTLTRLDFNTLKMSANWQNFRFTINNSFIGVKSWDGNLDDEPIGWNLSNSTFNYSSYDFDSEFFIFSNIYTGIYIIRYDNVSFNQNNETIDLSCNYNIPSTEEECNILIDGYYNNPPLNNCSAFDILDCINSIGNFSTNCTYPENPTENDCNYLTELFYNGTGNCTSFEILDCINDVNVQSLSDCNYSEITSEFECRQLSEGYYNYTNNCTRLQLLDCIKRIPQSEEDEINEITGLSYGIGFIENNIKLIVGFGLALFIVIFVATKISKDLFTVTLSGVGALIISVIIGLIHFVVLIYVLLAVIVIFLFGIFILKSKSD